VSRWGAEPLRATAVAGTSREARHDGTVKGGTGWGAEFAKICNKPLFVFDQERNGWFAWDNGTWNDIAPPVIGESQFTGTGTRFLEPNGRQAIADLFDRSFR